MEEENQDLQKVPKNNIFEIQGNILQFQEAQIIVQQTNCTSKGAKGLSYDISQKLGVDLYKNRQANSIPGSISIDAISHTHLKTNLNPQYVASIFAQYSPGKTSYKINKDGILDSEQNRQLWFQKGLTQLSEQMSKKNIKKVAFPFQIGCGLAGGSWVIYHRMLKKFAEKNQQFDVYIVSLPNTMNNNKYDEKDKNINKITNYFKK